MRGTGHGPVGGILLMLNILRIMWLYELQTGVREVVQLD